MVSRRGPELARGEWRQVIQRVLGIANANLRMHPAVQALSESDKATVLADFSRARRHNIITLSFKLSPWMQLPYVLIGLGYHDEEQLVGAESRRSGNIPLRPPPCAGACFGCSVVQRGQHADLSPGGFCVGTAFSC